LRSSSTTNFPWLSPAENLSGTAVCCCIPILLTLNWNWLHTRYITSAPTTQKTFHVVDIVETCVLSHCIATIAALTIASLPSNEQQTFVLLLLRAFRGFYGFNSYCMGETGNTKCDMLPSNTSVISRITCLSLCLFGLSLAELQLFTSQSYNTSYLELLRATSSLTASRTELNCLHTG
jgi:hypothetical protein